ncbi:MAG TPA: hypothetical protein VIJ25_08425, partial [Methylococcales bacterium]
GVNHAQIGQIAGIIAFFQIIPYVVSILRGHTKPERTSYLIWLIVDIISIASYISVGARSTIWTGLVFCLTGFLVLMLSIKHGIGGFSKFDLTCLFLALAGVAIWISSDNALVVLYFVTFVKFIGYLPTIKKTYFLPKTENTLSWSLTAFASVLNLFALTSLQPRFALPVVSTALLQVLIAYLLLFPARFKHTKRSPHKVHLFLAHPIFAK